MGHFHEWIHIHEVVDPADYGINLKKDKPLDESESRVYLGIDPKTRLRKVVKIFNGINYQLINYEVLARLKQLTAKVAETIERNPDFMAELGLKLKVIQIEKIGKVEGKDLWCSVSEFVPGINFFKRVLPYEEITKLIKTLDQLNKWLQSETGEPDVRVDTCNIMMVGGDDVYYITDVCALVATLNPKFMWRN